MTSIAARMTGFLLQYQLDNMQENRIIFPSYRMTEFLCVQYVRKFFKNVKISYYEDEKKLLSPHIHARRERERESFFSMGSL